MKYSNTTSAERVRELLEYDPETGEFTWRETRNNKVKAGQRAGSQSGSGYIYIGLDGVKYLAHRLAWLYVHGEWPDDDLDHRNLDRTDNRIDNLREASHSQNGANSCLRVNNTSGFKGVGWKKSKAHSPCPWRARIKKNMEDIHLGYFPTPEEAHAAYAAAARRLQGEFARTA